MEWNKSKNGYLLCDDTEQDRSELNEKDARSSFDSDYDRIVFSSAFRRLQDKAQVFPLEKSDFVRTRLTHSLEVGAIGRSIGISIEKELHKNEYIDKKYLGNIPVILHCAGLAHDLGNPPFGHYGEETIKRFFKDLFKASEGDNPSLEREKLLKKVMLNNAQKRDFEKFDGNSQTIRILTRLQCLNDKFGVHITYATLATLMKYPMNSLLGNQKDKGIAYKKFGYFQSESEVAEKILKSVGTYVSDGQAHRHPLAYLLEAADDIAYSVADLEDGFKKKLITIEDISQAFSDDDDITNKIKLLIKNNEYETGEKVVHNLRIFLQGIMIKEVVDTFIKNQNDILDGVFNGEILLESKAKNIRKRLKEIANENILVYDEIYKTELAGQSVIEYLLNFFVDVIGTNQFIEKKINMGNNSGDCMLNGHEKRVYSIISKDYRVIYEKKIQEIMNNTELNDEEKLREVVYNTYLLITDFISGMTDNYSVDLYKRLKGIVIN